MVLKRKSTANLSERGSQNEVEKKQRRISRKAPIAGTQPSKWPEYFHLLFKIFEAINTVLAFVSSKRQLATSFSAVRSSVEGLLKHPLEMSRVSEIKALLPDLVKFSYIPPSELQLHATVKSGPSSVDYSKNVMSSSTTSGPQKGHVLVLDFQDAMKGKIPNVALNSFMAPSTMSPAAVKKLIDARNNIFVEAINELLIATPAGDDPVQLLMTAGRNYVPVDHTVPAVDLETPVTIPKPDERPSIDYIISELTHSIWYVDQLVHRRTVEAKDALIASLDPPMLSRISDAIIKTRNIRSLYSHQVAAIDAIRQGKNVVVSTSTASGKSMIYQIPLLTFLEEDVDATVMLIFPTKALAQDQKASLEQLFQNCTGLDHLRVATYDGDTPLETRAGIRDTASVILTNFDTLHASILPNEDKWRSFLKRLKVLAVDELHYYTGLFGSHVAQIIRRFRRVCAAVGNRRIRFISCSATLANPVEYMSKMFALDPSDVEVVSNDGAPSGAKDYLVWNPPYVDAMHPPMGRKSSLSEASKIMRFLMKKGVRVILFCKIRKVCELAMKTIKTDLSDDGRLDILEMVRAYRGGYTREDRRKIEHEAFSGQLLGIIATNALELGIDIGALDAVIMLGFPLTISNFKQQAGRAGRRSRDSLAIMIADPFPVDQHYVNNPSELFENSLDDLIIDIDNEVILEAHLQCAGYEIPLMADDEKWFGPSMKDICEQRLKKDDDGWYHTHPKFLPFPSKYVSIRGAQEETYMVIELMHEEAHQATFMLEEIEFSRALYELYEGGVFIHQGDSFIIREVSHDSKTATVVRTDVNYHTSPRDLTRIEPLQTFRTRSIKSNLAHFGKLKVIIKVFGFFKISGGNILDAIELLTPPWERDTTGFWVDIPHDILEILDDEKIDRAEAIHAAEHAFLNQFSLSDDMKTDCRVVKEEHGEGSTTKRPPRLIFYDAAGKTGGVAARAFDHVYQLFNRANAAVENCVCGDGCTSCVQSTTCKDANLISSKAGARVIFKGLLNPDKLS